MFFDCPLDGINLIEASAGTGKTWAICGLYVRLLLEREFTVREILVVTFTKAATAELRERIRARSGNCAILWRRSPVRRHDPSSPALPRRSTKPAGAAPASNSCTARSNPSTKPPSSPSTGSVSARWRTIPSRPLADAHGTRGG